MDDLENKLGQLLSDPETMSKIMTLAQSLNKSTADPPQEQRKSEGKLAESSGFFPEIDPAMLQKLAGFAMQSGIDKNEQTLLKALGPYLSHERILKLEKAMRAAKMAKMATTLLAVSGTGR